MFSSNFRVKSKYTLCYDQTFDMLFIYTKSLFCLESADDDCLHMEEFSLKIFVKSDGYVRLLDKTDYKYFVLKVDSS